MSNMPSETRQAIEWALSQTFNGESVTIENCMALVCKVREYFNANNIEYSTFCYEDLIPFLS